MSEPNRIDNTNREIVRSAFNGWFMLVLNIVLFFGGLALLVRELQRSGGQLGFNWLIVLGIALPILAVILLGGLFTLQPNEARVLILFGAYHGTEQWFFVGESVLLSQPRRRGSARRHRETSRPERCDRVAKPEHQDFVARPEF